MDWQHRKLYFNNMDFVTLDSVAYTWHKVEVISLDGQGRYTLTTDVTQPRGIFVTARYWPCNNLYDCL